MAKYLDENGLIYVWNKLKSFFVAKEAGKGLSSNDLTDELLEKINSAGSSSFSGAYADLSGKPSIGGHAIASGDQTAASLGLATPEDVSSAVSDEDAAIKEYISQKGYQTASQVETIVTGKGYQTAGDVSSAISSAISAVLTYKGTVASVSALPSSKQKLGDVWHVTDDAGEYAWDGSEWQALGSSIDLSAYLLKTDVSSISNGDIDDIFS